MQTILVRDVFEPGESSVTLLPEESSLEEVVSVLANQPVLNGVFLVDKDQRFAGVITRGDILKWASIRLGPSAGESMLEFSRGELARLVLSTQAKDLAFGDWRTMGVKLDDNLQTALGQMLQHNEVSIPVLDDDGRVLADLKLSRVLLKALEAPEQ